MYKEVFVKINSLFSANNLDENGIDPPEFDVQPSVQPLSPGRLKSFIVILLVTTKS